MSNASQLITTKVGRKDGKSNPMLKVLTHERKETIIDLRKIESIAPFVKECKVYFTDGTSIMLREESTWIMRQIAFNWTREFHYHKVG